MLRSVPRAHADLDRSSDSPKRKPAAGSFGSMVYNTEDTAQGVAGSSESQEAGRFKSFREQEVNAPLTCPFHGILIVSHGEQDRGGSEEGRTRIIFPCGKEKAKGLMIP